MLTTDALTFFANAAWQVTAIAALAVVCARASRRAPAALRHGLYAAALVMSVVAPLLSLHAVRTVSTAAPSCDAPSSLPATVARVTSLRVGPIAAHLWLAAIALLVGWRLLRLVQATWQTRRIARSVRGALSDSQQAAAMTIARMLGVRRFQVVTSAGVRGPLTLGALSPTIVLPAALAESAQHELLVAALGHELAHVRRHDFAWNMVFELLVTVLAFHPAAWFLKRRLDETRELACDEIVASGLVERRAYARCLLTLASAALESGPDGYALGAVAPPLLAERVRRLVDAPPAARRWLPLVAAIAVVSVPGVASAGFALGVVSQEPVIGVDWVAEGAAACAAGRFPDADLAWGQLDEEHRAELVDRCSGYGVAHCDTAGFERP